MKQIFFILIIAALISCNNSGTSNNTSDTQATPNPANVQNVNGNVPDTTNGTNLNGGLPMDSSRVKDSARR